MLAIFLVKREGKTTSTHPSRLACWTALQSFQAWEKGTTLKHWIDSLALHNMYCILHASWVGSLPERERESNGIDETPSYLWRIYVEAMRCDCIQIIKDPFTILKTKIIVTIIYWWRLYFYLPQVCSGQMSSFIFISSINLTGNFWLRSMLNPVSFICDMQKLLIIELCNFDLNRP